MSRSLKKVGLTIAEVVGMPEATVYERQRLLFKGGLLPGDGRGPGSGVRATPESVATLLIALLATTDSLGKTEDRTRRFLKLKSDTRKCLFTGKATFGEALAAILAMPKLPKVWLQVSPTRNHASITYPGGRDRGVSEFTIDGKPANARITGMHVSATIFEGLHLIAEAIGGKDAR
jgi:hypothetical protein